MRSFELRDVRRVIVGINNLWQLSDHGGVTFDSSMLALHIIVKQNLPISDFSSDNRERKLDLDCRKTD